MAAGPAEWGEVARRRLETVQGRIVGEAADGEQAVAVVSAHRPAVVLVDREIPPGGALAVLPALARAHPPVRMLVVTGQPDDAFALDVVGRGGHGVMAEEALAQYLPKAVRCLAAGQAWLTRWQEAQVLAALWRLVEL